MHRKNNSSQPSEIYPVTKGWFNIQKIDVIQQTNEKSNDHQKETQETHFMNIHL